MTFFQIPKCVPTCTVRLPLALAAAFSALYGSDDGNDPLWDRYPEIRGYLEGRDDEIPLEALHVIAASGEYHGGMCLPIVAHHQRFAKLRNAWRAYLDTLVPVPKEVRNFEWIPYDEERLAPAVAAIRTVNKGELEVPIIDCIPYG